MPEQPDPPFDAGDAEMLLDIAEATLAIALRGGQAALPPLDALPRSLRASTGAFVTLTVAGHLNGCVGQVDGIEPLGHAVARLALSAAFADPRLPPLTPAEFPHLTIELSLLSPLTAVPAAARSELLEAIEAGRDGLVVSAGTRRGLFLPSVWEQLPDPEDFLDHLWLKARLTPRTWPPGIQAFRFTAQRYERGPNARRSAA